MNKFISRKELIWFFVFLLAILVLPIQILINSPAPSLFPYILILVYILFSKSRIYETKITINSTKLVNLINVYLFIYILLFLIHSIWQSVFQVASANDIISSFIIYIFPVLPFFYLKKYSTNKIYTYILYAILISAIIVGLYFVYDSYTKLVLGEISNYSIAVTEYEKMRKGVTDINEQRLKIFERAYGLLETHSISAAWISFGSFSFFAIKKKLSFSKKFLIILFTLIILIIGLNLTGIFSFFITIIFVEFGFYKIFFGLISKKNLKQFVFLIFVFLLLFFLIHLLLPNQIQVIGVDMFSYFRDLLSGDMTTNDQKISFLDLFKQQLLLFPQKMFTIFPPGILIGDGFTQGFGFQKGGDYGYLDSIYRIGIPLFIFTFIVFIKILKFCFNQIQNNGQNVGLFKFYASVLIYISIAEFHYSIWNSKSILLLLFSFLPILYKKII